MSMIPFTRKPRRAGAVLAVAAAVAGFAVVGPAAGAFGSTTDGVAVHTMTQSQARAYTAQQHVPYGSNVCFWAEATQYLHSDLGVGPVVAWIKNHTNWCQTLQGSIVAGSVTVQPTVHVATGWSSSAHQITVGYPSGYKVDERNTCALTKITWSADGMSGEDHISGRIQIQAQKGPNIVTGNSVACLTNLGKGTF